MSRAFSPILSPAPQSTSMRPHDASTSIGRIAKPPVRKLEPGEPAEPKGRRPVYFAEAGDYVDCPIYDRYALAAGVAFAGPAVIEEFDSTTVVHPGFSVSVDDVGNLIIEREAA